MTATLVLVGEGQDGRDRLVQLVQRLAPDLHVMGCGPAAAEREISRLVSTGESVVDVVPLALLAAGDAGGGVVQAADAVRVARAFGPHPYLLVAAAARVEAVVPRERWSQTAVLVVGETGTDPQVNAEVAKAARLLQEGRPLGTVETAFSCGAEPSVTQGLDRAHRLGYDCVVVLAWTLFDGLETERIEAQARSWAAGQPDVAVTLAGPIGPGPELAAVVLERWGELHTGDLRTNCDTCHYRAHEH